MWWILTIIYLAMIFAVLLLERKNPTEAMLWVIILICLPYLGMVLYLIFGDTMAIKLTSYIRKKRLSKSKIQVKKASNPSIDLEGLSDEDLQVIKFNQTYNQSDLTCYENVEIYTNGEDHYRQLFADIKQAKECIYIEFYTIHHDIMGESLIKALTQKAKEGVTVYVMCDFIANLSTPAKMFKPLKEAGGRVIRVKPFFTHYRSHRKIVVIDHSIAYIGGMNIGKQYANLAKKKNPWRDTQVRMSGACCVVLDKYFLTDWLCSIHKKGWNEMIEKIQQIEYPEYQTTPQCCQFVVGGVDTNKESVKMCYLSMIRSAKKCIYIQSPYFIPDTSVLDALKTALASGVKVVLMVPGIKASFFLDPVTTYYCGQLLEYGAEVYKYQGYIHAKTMVIDEELCCIGSVNMDMRSLMVDDEVCGVFYHNQMVEQYRKIYEEDIQHCKPYTYEDFVTRSNKERFLESFFVLFAPLM